VSQLGPNQPIAQLDGTSGNETIVWLHTDHLLTPRIATDQNGSKVWQWTGDAFGQSKPTINITTVNLRLPGQYYDVESGLHYNHFRDYDPELGRYLQSDPIGLAGGMNTYGYAYQNPLMNTDPNGLLVTPQTIGGAVGFLVGAGYSYFVNGCDLGTAFFDGFQAGAAGFVSGGGSLLLGFTASAGASAARSNLEGESINAFDTAANGAIAVTGGSIGKVVGKFVPKNMVQVSRGFFGRLGERLGLVGPKMIDKNASLRANVGAGFGSGTENAMAGAYTGGKCGCN